MVLEMQSKALKHYEMAVSNFTPKSKGKKKTILIMFIIHIYCIYIYFCIV